MDPKIRLERHAELWAAGEKSVRRTIISGSIFAAVVLFNVLEPYAEAQEREVAVRNLEAAEKEVVLQLASLESTESELGKIATTLKDPPWADHKEDLKLRFRRGEIREPQREADETIHEIAEEVRRKVAAPLEEVVAKAPASARLGVHPEKVSAAIDVWEEKHIDTEWFDTVRRKDATVRRLDETMAKIQREATRSVQQLQQAVKAERLQLADKKSSLAAGISKEKDEIEKALDGVIPVWAKGLVTVDLMVRVYPLALVGIAIYLVGSALSAARHFRAMAVAHGWSREERSDPVMSSLLTLTYRRPAGTAITVACYLLVLLFLWFCLVRGINAVGMQDVPGAVAWLPHVAMLVAIGVAIAAPLRGRSAP